MQRLWNKTFELFRRHIVLWIPCSTAGILMLMLGSVNTAAIRWLMRILSTQHSVLGGEVPVADPAHAQQQMMMLIYPLGLLREFTDVCLFVVALAATKTLVQMILEEQVPDMRIAVREIAPRYREVLLFSLKYIAVLAIFGGILLVLTASPLMTENFHKLAVSKVFVYVYGLLVQGCLAWLLVPSAIRLLRPPGSPGISPLGRQMGTVFAVATAAGSLALQFLVGKAETTFMLENRWEGEVLAVVNTVIINTPQVLLFIALALLAIQGVEDETSLAAAPDMTWNDQISP